MSNRKILYFLVALAIVSIALLFYIGPKAQDLEYHCFSDRNNIFSINNFHNVISNLPFLIVSLIGLMFYFKNRNKWDLYFKILYLVLFLGIALTGIGSAYYHYSPNNSTLVWDRLPMTLVFTSIFALVVNRAINLRVSKVVFYSFFTLGILSIVYWWYSETINRGDLRPYAFVQFFPIISVLTLLISKKFNGKKWILLMCSSYIIAKFCESYDHEINQLISYSGHSLKHLFAAISTWFVYKFVMNE
jgi:hypothetical protein